MFNRKRQVTELTTTDGKGKSTLIIIGYANKEDKSSPSTEECLLPYTIIGREGPLRIIQADKCFFRNLAPTLRGDRESTIRNIEFLNPKVFLYDMEEGTIVPYRIN